VQLQHAIVQRAHLRGSLALSRVGGGIALSERSTHGDGREKNGGQKSERYVKYFLRALGPGPAYIHNAPSGCL